jgi:hypothetical protein
MGEGGSLRGSLARRPRDGRFGKAGGDTQCNLVVVLLRLGSLEEARAVVDDAKAELVRAEQVVPAHLLQPGAFVAETMNNLADLGERMGADPASWQTDLP